jgi:hypothetical protein
MKKYISFGGEWSFSSSISMGHGFHGYIKQPEGAYIYILYMGAIDIYIYILL